MQYNEAVSWLHTLGRVTDEPGPNRMRALMAALGNPQRRLRFVHVAGTNGKGSATVMLASILKEAGYTVGANISPYVLDFRERFQVNGQYASEHAIAAALTQVRAACESLSSPVIEFMAATAAALVLFADAGCELVCLEAGIGGAHDDTNVVENTLVACMMRIGLDHTELLGESLAEIARDKCGIFKNKCDVVCYPAQPAAALQVVRQQAKNKHCNLVVPALEDIHFYKSGPFENRINYGGYDLHLPFLGPHQALNASVAVEAALCLWRRGYAIEDEHIIKGIENARLPARIEVLSKRPLIILDGAHNQDSVEALVLTLKAGRVAGLVGVVGVLRDKQPDKMLQALTPYIHTLYTVTPPETPRAMSAAELARLAEGRFKRVVVCKSLEDAASRALAQPLNGILVCGSFYLASAAKAAFAERN